MKLHELHNIEVIWEGDIEGEDYILFVEPLEEGVIRAAVANKKGGLVRGLARTAVGLAKNPVVVGMAAGMAIDAYQNYKRNKRYTTRFYAKDMQERRLYQKIVDDLMRTGQYKKVREKYVSGGYMWELKRKGV